MPETRWRVEVLRAGDWRGATTCLLTLDSRHVLVDTGSWHEDSLLAEALARRGLHPTDIDIVINTHFHIDHVMNNCLFAGSQSRQDKPYTESTSQEAHGVSAPGEFSSR